MIQCKSSKQFEFLLGNKIGIIFHDEGFNSISSISIGNGYAYFADIVYNRVNKLNYDTGEIEYSAKEIIDEMIVDLFYFNHFIYVITLESSIYVLNENLELLNKYNYSLSTSAGWYFEKTLDTLKINVLYNKSLQEFKLMDGNLISKKARFISDEQEYFSIRDKIKTTIQGKKFLMLSCNENYCLKNRFGCFFVGTGIENYEVPNFDFNNNIVIYFTVNEKKVIFHINEY